MKLDSTAETRQRIPPSIPRGLAVVVLGLFAVLGLSLTAEAVKATKAAWTRVVTVTKPRAAGPVLESVFHQVVRDGMGDDMAARMLKQLGDYIDVEVAERGAASLSVGMMVDTVEATHEAKWSPDNASRLIIALQRDLNLGHTGENERLQGLLGRVRDGVAPEQILGDGTNLKEDKKPLRR
jgi:hypothetical protein